MTGDWIHTTRDVIDDDADKTLADLGIETGEENKYTRTRVAILKKDLVLYTASVASPGCTNIKLSGEEHAWCINMKYEELRAIIDGE